MKRVISGILGAALVVLMAPQARAIVGDQWNLQAAGAASDGVGTYSHVAVRKSDGTIWLKQINPTVGTWFSVGGPPGGCSSGPQLAYLNNTLTVFVRGPYPSDPGNIWAAHNGTGGYVWAPTYGRPPVTTITAPAVAGDPQAGLLIVIADNTLAPWYSTVSTSGSQSAWAKVGTSAVNAAPGAAINGNQDLDVYGLFSPSSNIQVTVCGFPTCFGSWTNLGGVVISGVGAAGFKANGGNNWVGTGVLGTNSALFINQSENLGSYSGWISHGSPAGVTLNSTPSLTYFKIGTPLYTFVHGSDGNYWMFTGSWTNIGHP